MKIRIRMKQNIPKLCIGRSVCHIWLLGSSLVHTLISVKAKIRSKTISKMVLPRIYSSACWYYFQRKWVLALLPNEIYEENNSKVVIGPDETAEQSHNLLQWMSTRIARQAMSIRWSTVGSTDSRAWMRLLFPLLDWNILNLENNKWVILNVINDIQFIQRSFILLMILNLRR